ncbi:hypothetical protein U9M48_009530 [Paspalum notatum var. saurae]|uniref:Uncharacterized protein n=1 Tax=Paspalum notatum var. saurae TaxID=547442 RepID=A0AAQ3SR40_PASNO
MAAGSAWSSPSPRLHPPPLLLPLPPGAPTFPLPRIAGLGGLATGHGGQIRLGFKDSPSPERFARPPPLAARHVPARPSCFLLLGDGERVSDHPPAALSFLVAQAPPRCFRRRAAPFRPRLHRHPRFFACLRPSTPPAAGPSLDPPPPRLSVHGRRRPPSCVRPLLFAVAPLGSSSACAVPGPSPGPPPPLADPATARGARRMWPTPWRATTHDDGRQERRTAAAADKGAPEARVAVAVPTRPPIRFTCVSSVGLMSRRTPRQGAPPGQGHPRQASEPPPRLQMSSPRSTFRTRSSSPSVGAAATVADAVDLSPSLPDQVRWLTGFRISSVQVRWLTGFRVSSAYLCSAFLQTPKLMFFVSVKSSLKEAEKKAKVPCPTSEDTIQTIAQQYQRKCTFLPFTGKDMNVGLLLLTDDNG